MPLVRFERGGPIGAGLLELWSGRLSRRDSYIVPLAGIGLGAYMTWVDRLIPRWYPAQAATHHLAWQWRLVAGVVLAGVIAFEQTRARRADYGLSLRAALVSLVAFTAGQGSAAGQPFGMARGALFALGAFATTLVLYAFRRKET